MFRHLLVPIDDSAEAAVSLPAARTLARAGGATITLLRVVPEDAGPGAVDEATAALAKVAAELRGADVEVAAIVRQGSVADVVVAETRAHGADLIVMATHGRGGIARAVLGGVTQHVVAHSPVPVLAVRPGGRRLTRLETFLVPVDGTPGGAMALGLALALARAHAASLEVFQATLPLLPLTVEPYGGGAYVDPQWEEDARLHAEAYVQALAERLRRAGVEARGRATIGQPVREICEAAEAANADLVVMSTHAHTGVKRALLGSVAEGVVEQAGRPVLLLPPGAQLPRREGGPAATAAAPK
jgi:nucleotide-binding universal stress UspA family protein